MCHSGTVVEEQHKKPQQRIQIHKFCMNFEGQIPILLLYTKTKNILIPKDMIYY